MLTDTEAEVVFAFHQDGTKRCVRALMMKLYVKNNAMYASSYDAQIAIDKHFSHTYQTGKQIAYFMNKCDMYEASKFFI